LYKITNPSVQSLEEGWLAGRLLFAASHTIFTNIIDLDVQIIHNPLLKTERLMIEKETSYKTRSLFLALEMTVHLLKKLELRKIYSEH
jgi:hypothetical protein